MRQSESAWSSWPREAATSYCLSKLGSLGYPDATLIAAGMEGLVFQLNERLVAKVWPGAPKRRTDMLKRLQTFYRALARQDLPLMTPYIEQIVALDAASVTIERALPGAQLRSSTSDQSRGIQQSTIVCLTSVLQALASVRPSTDLAGLAVLGEAEPLARIDQSWSESLVGLLERRVAQFGDQLRESVHGFDTQFDNMRRLIKLLPRRACSVIHGDLVPPNVLVDASERPLAVLDFGFLSTVGDPAFDAAVCASTFDMYSANADATRELLTREFASRLDYRVEELRLYQAAYAVATSNAYDADGQDGHFAWCVQRLQRPDVADLLGLY